MVNNNGQVPSFLSVKVGTRIKLLELTQIIYVQAAGNYVGIAMATGETIHTKEAISHIANRLPEQLFIRIHRSYLVNLGYVKEIRSRRKNYEFTMANGIRLLSGTTYRKHVRDQFAIGLRRGNRLVGIPLTPSAGGRPGRFSDPQSEEAITVETGIRSYTPEDD